MQISSLEEYGLRCALNLASAKTHLSSSQIAEKEGISVEYVSKIMHLFRKGNLVEAVRGVHGGFKLAQTPTELTVKQVFDCLNGRPASEVGVQRFCSEHPGHQTSCVHIDDCAVRPVWTVLQTYFSTLLSQIRLVDLINGENAVNDLLTQMAEDHLQKVKSTIESRKKSAMADAVCKAKSEMESHG